MDRFKIKNPGNNVTKIRTTPSPGTHESYGKGDACSTTAAGALRPEVVETGTHASRQHVLGGLVCGNVSAGFWKKKK